MINPSTAESAADQQPVNSMETTAYKEILLQEAERKLKRVKLYLWLIGGVQLVIGIVFYFVNKELGLYAFLVQTAVAALFFGIALLVNKKPKAGVITALVVYGGLILVSAIGNPASLTNGIILKAVIIYAFVKGIKTAGEVEELREKLGKLEINNKDLPIDLVN